MTTNFVTATPGESLDSQVLHVVRVNLQCLEGWLVERFLLDKVMLDLSFVCRGKDGLVVGRSMAKIRSLRPVLWRHGSVHLLEVLDVKHGDTRRIPLQVIGGISSAHRHPSAIQLEGH